MIFSFCVFSGCGAAASISEPSALEGAAPNSRSWSHCDGQASTWRLLSMYGPIHSIAERKLCEFMVAETDSVAPLHGAIAET